MTISFKHPAVVQLVGFLIILFYAAFGAIIFLHLESGVATAGPKYSSLQLNYNTTKCFKKSLNNARSIVITDDSNIIQLAECLKTKTEMQKQDWSFTSSLLFTFTVITTIGYGHVSPVTFAGRLFFIFYALIGIPITLVFIANVGAFIVEGGKRFYKWLKQYLPSRQMEEDEEEEKDISTGGLFIVGLVVYTSLGAIILPFYEQMSFFEAFYFIFVSLTTIGFGDIYPENPVMILFSLAYISMGLAITSVAINVLSLYLKKLHHFGRKLTNLKNVEIYFGSKKVTVDSLVGAFADKHGIPRPTEADLDNLVEEAVAETKNPQLKLKTVVIHAEEQPICEDDSELLLEKKFDSDSEPEQVNPSFESDSTDLPTPEPILEYYPVPQQQSTQTYSEPIIMPALEFATMLEPPLKPILEYYPETEPLDSVVIISEPIFVPMKEHVTVLEPPLKLEPEPEAILEYYPTAKQPIQSLVIISEPVFVHLEQTKLLEKKPIPQIVVQEEPTIEPREIKPKPISRRQSAIDLRPVEHHASSNIFNTAESLVSKAGNVKHDPKKRYEQFQKEWSRMKKSPKVSRASTSKKKNA